MIANKKNSIPVNKASSLEKTELPKAEKTEDTRQ